MPSDTGWYYVKDGKPVGPMTREELIQILPSVGGAEAMVYGPTTGDWMKARHVSGLRISSGATPPPAL